MPRRRSLTKGRWRAFALSLLLHAGIVAAAVFGWFTWKRSPPPIETLAIEASVVDENALKGFAPPPQPAPAPPPEPAPPPPTEPAPAPVEEQGPPKPDPAELERKQEEERLAQEKIEQEKQEQQKLESQKQAQERKERDDAERIEAQKQAAAEKKALEKKRADDAAAAKKAAEEKARLAREAELRRTLEAEERGDAARNSDDAARWHAQIVARITRAWIRPPSARAGIECNVSVNQVMGGEVTSVRVNSCSGGDDALRDSVEAAVYRASPLPTPPPGVPFERILELTFAPND